MPLHELPPVEGAAGAEQHSDSAREAVPIGRHRHSQYSPLRRVATAGFAFLAPLTLVGGGQPSVSASAETSTPGAGLSGAAQDQLGKIVIKATPTIAGAAQKPQGEAPALLDRGAEIVPKKPEMFTKTAFGNGANIGALQIILNPSNNAKRAKDWGSIDAYSRTLGLAKHPNPANPLVHPLISDLYNTDKPIPGAYKGLTPDALDHKILGNGFVLDNQPGAPSDIYVIAGHNVTPVYTIMQIGNKKYADKRMGINAPLELGDMAEIDVPDPNKPGYVKLYTFVLINQGVTSMSDPNGYADLYKVPASADAPVLQLYHCTPDGQATERHWATFVWVTTTDEKLVLKRIK